MTQNKLTKNDKGTKNLNQTKSYTSSIITKLKLQTAKLGTNLSLAILAKGKKEKIVNYELDIPYCKNQDHDKSQTFDLFYPIDNKQKLPIIFYIHGGAWSSGDKAYYNEYCQRLCNEKFIIANINYRLIPDYTLNDVVSDCQKAMNFILKRHKQYKIDTTNIFMVGDSAGAHLCALLSGLNSIKGEKQKSIKGLSLYYGAYDLSSFANSPFKILKTLDKYFNETIDTNKISLFYKKFSPITYITPAFPPTLLISGKIDKLFPQSTKLEELLHCNNVICETLYFPKNRKDALHGFLNFTKSQPSQIAFDKTVEFFKRNIE